MTFIVNPKSKCSYSKENLIYSTFALVLGGVDKTEDAFILITVGEI